MAIRWPAVAGQPHPGRTHLGPVPDGGQSHGAGPGPQQRADLYFLRPGDWRRPVEFELPIFRRVGRFARRVTARQDGKILMEAMSSFKVANPASAQVVIYAVLQAPAPESLPQVAPHLAESDETTRGRWSSLRWFERRLIDVEVGAARPLTDAVAPHGKRFPTSRS